MVNWVKERTVTDVPAVKRFVEHLIMIRISALPFNAWKRVEMRVMVVCCCVVLLGRVCVLRAAVDLYVVVSFWGRVPIAGRPHTAADCVEAASIFHGVVGRRWLCYCCEDFGRD